MHHAQTERARDTRRRNNRGTGQDGQDIEAAAQEHEQQRLDQASRQDKATGQSEYLENVVYGGLDGIITTFAVVSGVVGASLSPGIILILGFANLLGDGFSMATGAYLSSKSGQEVYERERQHAAEQVARAPHREKQALVELYQGQGYPGQDARRLQEIVSREPGRWVSAILAEKHLMLPERRKAVLEGVATFVAFVVAGSIPLLVYLVAWLLHLNLDATASFASSIALSGVALLGLGAAKVFVTGNNPWRSGLQMLLVGSIAAAVAFSVGAFLRSLVGETF